MLRLENRYIPALLLIVILAFFAYANVKEIMQSIQDDGRMINISGKQRMLSQKLIVDAKNYLENEQLKTTFKSTIEQLQLSHELLTKNIKSQSLQELYFSDGLDKDIQNYLKGFKSILETKDENFLYILRDESKYILIKLDSAVKLYEHINQTKLATLQQRATNIFLLILILLALEAIFIFYPASQKIKSNTEHLQSELKDAFAFISEHISYSKTDSKGIIIDVSKAFCKASGYTREELVGEPHNIIRHPDMPSSAFKNLWDTIEQGKTWQGEVKNKTKNGGFFWSRSIISPMYNEKNKIVGYHAVRENITDHKIAEELHDNVNLLLDNANDGFIPFDFNFKILDGYSLQAKKILEDEYLIDKNITNILFKNDEENKSLFIYGVESLKNCDEDSKDLVLSLLPQISTIKQKYITIEYKYINNNKMMLILNDRTQQNKLEEKLKIETEHNKMIINAAKRKNEFLDLNEKMKKFLALEKYPQIDELLRTLHTFKGLFAQEYFHMTPKTIHTIESKIEKSEEKELLARVLIKNDLKNSFEQDLSLIYSILGENFFIQDQYISISHNEYEQLKKNLANNDIPTLQTQVLSWKQKYLYEILLDFQQTIHEIAKNLFKPIYPLQIKGDYSLMLEENYFDFTDSLIHVFRNMLDHGIETQEERKLYKKDLIGTIKCTIINHTKDFTLIIEDDGRGLDIETIKSKLIENGILSKEEIDLKNEKEIFDTLFLKNFSTKNEVSEISGRGIGLDALAYEVKKLNGTINIETQTHKFTRFIFTIPKIS